MYLDVLAGDADHVVVVIRRAHLDPRSFAVVLAQDGFFSLYGDDGTIAVAKIRSALDDRDIALADVFTAHRVVSNAKSANRLR